MAAIEFCCPSCQATVRAPESASGRKAHCPKCGCRCTVPDPFPENAAFDFHQNPSINPEIQNETMGRFSQKSMPSRFFFVFIVLLVIGICGGIAIYFFVLKSTQRQELEDRYQQLCKRESELIDRSENLFNRLTRTKDPKEQKDLRDKLQIAHIELEDVYMRMEGALRDRIAINGGRPGDHYKLEKISQQRTRLKGMRKTIEEWIYMKEIQKGLQHSQDDKE